MDLKALALVLALISDSASEKKLGLILIIRLILINKLVSESESALKKSA